MSQGADARRADRPIGRCRTPWLAAAFLWAGLVAGNASALGLGAASVHSSLGDPLRLTFPVTVQRDEEVGCIQIRAKGDDLPAVFNTRTSVIRNGFQTRIEIRSIQPVNEPAIGLVVSVGCASPISREYVVFLDPPIVPPAAEATPLVAAPVPARVERPVTPRRPSSSARSTGEPVVRAAPPRAAVRAPRTRPPVRSTAPNEAPQASTQPAVRTPPPAPIASPGKSGDRLTVVPTETAPLPAAPGPAASAPLATGPVVATNPTVPPVAVAPAIQTPTVPMAAATSPTIAPAADAGESLAREQAMRQQQAELQRQIKALGDQINDLKVQTTTLTTRNQLLEQSVFAPWLLWLLVALAALAIIVAGWMAWRYTQLRRSIEGSAWWTSNTGFVASDGERPDGVETRAGAVVTLDPGTRLAPRPPASDVRTAPQAPTQVAAVSNVERPRPKAPTPQRYPTPIDTDFTVSDIEAAMATVRTVSPPRDAARPPPVTDTDFAPLGGPTMPSPFAEPPAPSATPRASHVVKRDGDDIGKFVDLDIPPLPAATRLPSANDTRAAADPPRPAAVHPDAYDETEPLDFKLDIPATFDPLATDSHKTTVIDRAEGRSLVDFEMAATPTALDFELPFADGVKPLTGSVVDPSPRHGATALDDLFASQTGPGVDTILNLDERDGSPLSTTEVDRLTTTAIEGAVGDAAPTSMRARMARFADLLDQVDEVEDGDPLRAIALLRQYVLRDENIPTLLWLRLFALYNKVDKKPVYEALAEHFARRYHRPMIGWGGTLADRVPQTPLSAMGQIDREIEAQWGKAAGLERLHALVCGRDQDDAIVFNAVLQRDLLDAVKVFPQGADSHIG